MTKHASLPLVPDNLDFGRSAYRAARRTNCRMQVSEARPAEFLFAESGQIWPGVLYMREPGRLPRFHRRRKNARSVNQP
jgi:hypothetical protein